MRQFPEDESDLADLARLNVEPWMRPRVQRCEDRGVRPALLELRDVTCRRSSVMFNIVQVFSATKPADRAELGDRVTEWIRDHPDVEIVEVSVTQSSDESFHMLAIIVFGLDRGAGTCERAAVAPSPPPTAAVTPRRLNFARSKK